MHTVRTNAEVMLFDVFDKLKTHNRITPNSHVHEKSDDEFNEPS